MDKKKLVSSIVNEYLHRGLTSVSNPMPSGGSASASFRQSQKRITMNRYTFKLGDIVYYMSPIAEFSVKRARIAEIKMRKLRGSPVIETVDTIIMDNGDEVANAFVFSSKDEATSYLKKSVDSSLNGAKIALANIQQRIKKLEQIQRLLKENNK